MTLWPGESAGEGEQGNPEFLYLAYAGRGQADGLIFKKRPFHLRFALVFDILSENK
jgi:hypothetical protein